MTSSFENQKQYTWYLIKYYASHLGIKCPIDFHIRKLNRTYGRCGMILTKKYEYIDNYKQPKEPFIDRMYILSWIKNW